MTKRCYYEVLNVSRTASEDVIKKSYRRLAMECHPDRNPGDKEAEDRFKECAEAYEVLMDRERRGIYDRYGHEGLNSMGFSGPAGFEDIFSSFGDIFEDVFGFRGARSRSRPAARPGADLRYDLKLTFLEAVFGTEKDLEIEKYERCSQCDGAGTAPGTAPETCPRCLGRGQISQRSGFFTVSSTCGQCHGQGRIITTPCETCRGAGRAKVSTTVHVKIPAGVDTGARLRLRGEGEQGDYGAPSGDLYVFIHAEPHELFERRDDNVYSRLPISFVDAALGATTEVPTLEGTEKLKIPRGTPSGKMFRLKGKGVPHLRGFGRGDQIIELVIQVPTKLTKKQEELLREFARCEAP
jgi:molecular chaperone DnaJ